MLSTHQVLSSHVMAAAFCVLFFPRETSNGPDKCAGLALLVRGPGGEAVQAKKREENTLGLFGF